MLIHYVAAVRGRNPLVVNAVFLRHLGDLFRCSDVITSRFIYDIPQFVDAIVAQLN
jgi:hypothetical protein